MPTLVTHTHTSKVGTCPHGMPLGACPICNGMAGGNSTSKRDIPRNVGEMTYNQCAAIGAMLKAQKHAREQNKLNQQTYQENLANFAKNIEQTRQKLAQLSIHLENALPVIVAKPITFILNNIVGKTLQIVQNLTQNVSDLLNKISQKFADITDKLNAIYGEAKAFAKEKISKLIDIVKKNVIFKIFITKELETDRDLDKKYEEEKRISDLKLLFHKIMRKFKKNNQKEI